MKMLQSLVCSLLIATVFGYPSDYMHAPFPTENGVIAYYDTVIESLTKDGSVAWRFDVGRSGTMQYIGRAIETAARGQDGTLFVATSNGTLYAFADDGHVKWKIDVNCPKPSAIWSCFAPDAIHVDSDGTIFLRTAGVASDSILRTTPGSLYALSPGGKLIWSGDVPPLYQGDDHDLQSGVPPLHGKGASQDLVFVMNDVHDPRFPAGTSVSAWSKSKSVGGPSVVWKVPAVASNQSIDHIAVAADGALLMSGTLRDPENDCKHVISKYAATGTLLWSRSFICKDYGVEALTLGMDGTMYLNLRVLYPVMGSAQNLWALSPEGETKWNITIEAHNAIVSAPSDQNDKGDVFLVSFKNIDETLHGNVVAVHSDGSQNLLYDFGEKFNKAPPPFLGSNGLIYVQLTHETSVDVPGPLEPRYQVVAFLPDGTEKVALNGSSPAFASDGNIYIERASGFSRDSDGFTLSVVEVDSKTGSDKWEHVLSPPVGCKADIDGRECFQGFCRVPEKSWSPPPPACKQKSSGYCCYKQWKSSSSGVPGCAASCANNSACVAFDFGPSSDSTTECCLFANPGPASHITGASDNSTIRGCWVASTNGQTSPASEQVFV